MPTPQTDGTVLQITVHRGDGTPPGECGECWWLRPWDGDVTTCGLFDQSTGCGSRCQDCVAAEVPAHATNQGSCAPWCGESLWHVRQYQNHLGGGNFEACEQRMWQTDLYEDGKFEFKHCPHCGWRLDEHGVSHAPGVIGPETWAIIRELVAKGESYEANLKPKGLTPNAHEAIGLRFRAALAADGVPLEATQ